jgi:hypothetical protein
MTMRLTDRWLWALCAVVGIALVLRLWGIEYGLPLSYWTDEYHELMRAMQLGAGSFNFVRTTKGGFYLLLFFEYGVYFAVLKVLGVVASAREFAELFVRDPTMFYLIGRATAAFIGCVTVATVFWIARYAYSSLAALVGALLLAVNVLHVDVSHRIGVDVPMVAGAALALYFGLRIADEGGRRNYLWAAAFAALAVTTKLPGILVLIPLLIAHTYALSSTPAGVRGWFGSRDLWIALAVFVAILVATNPGVLGYVGLSGDPSGSPVRLAGPDELDDAPDFASDSRPNLHFFYFRVLLDSMGWPLLLSSLAALVWAVIRRNRADVMLLSYAVANYVAITTTSSENLFYPRYALPIILVMAILTGRMFADLLGALPRWRMMGGVVALASLAAWPVWTASVADHALTLTDTRTIAKDWFEANVPAGAKVLVEGGKTGPKRESVQLRESRSSLERRIAYWKRVEPRQARFLEVKLATDDGSGYDLVLVRQQSMGTLEDYAAAGVEYFVVRPEYFAASRKAGSGPNRLIRDLRSDPRVTLLRRFVPVSSSYPGDTVEVYRLARNGQGSVK